MKKNQLCFLCIPHAWGERLGTSLGCITHHPRRNLLALQGNQCQIGFHLASSISPIIAFDVRLCQYVKELTSL